MKQYLLLFLFCAFASVKLNAQKTENYNVNPFKQLKEELATPNVYRTASGAPGHEYWQQQADYKMSIVLDDEKQHISGDETITYYNNSPDKLSYLWVQLDQNVRAKDSDSYKISTQNISKGINPYSYGRMFNDFDGGFKIESVTTPKGEPMSYTINKTMMRIDLDSPLNPSDKVSFSIKWNYNINDRMEIGGRSGYEYFEEDDNYLYTIAQFFPRMCAYNDIEGWQNKQFLGRGEFTLIFGDYEVDVTAPADHVVEGTGEITNLNEVLTETQLARWEEAKTADKPVLIITQEEAEANEKSRSKETKTWKFKAENVRDFAFVSSRKFIWDAKGVPFGDRIVMAESLYPKEGNPLWEMYSTKAVELTLDVYSKYTFDYPYPKAISVHAANIGMEYPMICFNFGRPDKDGNVSDRTKYGMIGVIIHEIGHNYFPMIVNSDERQWTWMDEGLNTFLQYLTEKEWEDETGNPFPSRRGPAHKIVDYMKGAKDNISPIMTNSESIHQFGANAYAKPATALNILRETVMGPELFDHAFQEFSQRWMFKQPYPADFFRSMEDASSVDLDWFWRGWFFTNDHVDISLDDVKWFQLDTQFDENGELAINDDFWAAMEAPAEETTEGKKKKKKKKKSEKVVEEIITVEGPETFDPLLTWARKKETYENIANDYMTKRQRKLLSIKDNFYELTFTNNGGIPMPVILEFEYEDGTSEIQHIPAEVWKMGRKTITKVFITPKKVTRVVLDPKAETADTDLNNNYWPSTEFPSRFEEFKEKMGK